MVIHADEEGEKKRVESFVVGQDVEAGERVVWIVEGGKYKASFLVAEEGVDEWESRCLISEVSLISSLFHYAVGMGKEKGGWRGF